MSNFIPILCQVSLDNNIPLIKENYEKLKNGPYNIVLQSKVETNNNGSLSWAALEHGVRYINIETRLGWLSQQKKMLYFVERSIK